MEALPRRAGCSAPHRAEIAQENIMTANRAIQGHQYRVLACPAYEYLTIGQVYTCTHQGRHSTGFHRDGGQGPGTYLTGSARHVVAVEQTD